MFIDIHHHLVYGVDDGAETAEGSRRMARDAAGDGIEALIATAHIVPGRKPFPYDAYFQRLEEMRAFCRTENLPLQIYSGTEILYTPETPRMLTEGRVPTLAGSSFALVEFYPDETFEGIREAARRVSGAGFVPVIAHVERCAGIRKLDQLRLLREDYNARIQVNARTILRKKRFFYARWIRSIFDAGLADYIATDAHDMPERRVCMRAACEKLRQDYGEDAARAWTGRNAQEILKGNF